ncbi:MAG: hypothetical protein V3T07_01765 [Myxococcota bacterium]
MPLWTNIRRLAFSGAVQGVKNPGPLDVVTPAQAVSVVDAYAHWAAAPPRVPWILAEPATTTAVGEFTGIEIMPRVGPVFVVATWSPGTSNSTQAIWRDDEQVTAARTPVVRLVTGGVPNGELPTAGIFSVLITIAAFPANAERLRRTNGRDFPLPFVMYPGERWFITNSLTNTADTGAYLLREVPTVDRNPD